MKFGCIHEEQSLIKREIIRLKYLHNSPEPDFEYAVYPFLFNVLICAFALIKVISINPKFNILANTVQRKQIEIT